MNNFTERHAFGIVALAILAVAVVTISSFTIFPGPAGFIPVFIFVLAGIGAIAYFKRGGI